MMAQVGRAREFSETRGFIKVLVAADTGSILGAAILGWNGDEAIHCLLDVMYADKPYTVIQRAVHIHPTVAELIPTVLGELRPLDQVSVKLNKFMHYVPLILKAMLNRFKQLMPDKRILSDQIGAEL